MRPEGGASIQSDQSARLGYRVTKRQSTYQKRWGLMSALMLGLTACGGGELLTPMVTSDFTPVVISQAPYTGSDMQPVERHHTALESVVDNAHPNNNNPAVTTLEIGHALIERRLSVNEALPSQVMVPVTNLSTVPVTAALQAILAGTNISLAWNGKVADHVVSVENLSGPLPTVVDKICAAAEIFCTYRHGSLELQAEEAFVVDLPAGHANSEVSNAIGAGLTNALNVLAGNKVELDPQGGSLVYTADVPSEERVHSYLEQLRNGSPLVAMQLYVWDVALDRQNGEGINWSLLNPPRKSGGGRGDNIQRTEPRATTGNGVRLNAIALNHVKVTSLAEFLSTQGRLQSIDNGQLAFVGSAIEPDGLDDVQPLLATDYGAHVLNKHKGVDIDLNGAYEKDVVISNLRLTLKDESFGSSADQNVDATIRVRPGDTLVLAGVITPSSFFVAKPHGRDTMRKPHELVLALKPSVFLFTNRSMARASTPPLRQMTMQPPAIDAIPTQPVSVPLAAKPVAPVRAIAEPAMASEAPSDWPEPIMIDKNGVQAITAPPQTIMPIASPQPMPNMMPQQQSRIAPTVQSGIIANQANAAVLENASSSSLDEDDEVNQKLMQRSLSNAYDPMTPPSPLPPKYGDGL